MDEVSQKCNCGKHFMVSTIKNCFNCGIAEPPGEEDNKYCLKFKKHITGQELKEEIPCSFFINHIYEDGNLLSSFQHLLIREAQFASHK